MKDNARTARRRGRPRLSFLGLLLLVPLSPALRAQGDEVRTVEWGSGIIESFATLPVQDRGRVKPMDSVAGLKLLTLNGKRSLELADGEKLTHAEWLLDCLFRPEVAKSYPAFRVQLDGVLTAIGLTPKAKRAWYSYHELIPAYRELMTQASRHGGVEAKDQTTLQRQLLKLASDVREFEALTSTFAALRQPYTAGESARLAELVDPTSPAPLTALLRRADELQALRSELGHGDGVDEAAVDALLTMLSAAVDEGVRGLALMPPATGAPVADQDEWWSVADLVWAAFETDIDLEAHFGLLESLEIMVAGGDDLDEFGRAMAAFNAGVRTMAEARGEYGHVPLEVKLNRWDPFTNALVLFLLAFVLTGAGWLFTRARWLRWGVWGTTSVATALVVFGITLRCIIRDRPPIVSLYDTILFITGCIVIVCLALEWLTRLRIAIALATILGAAGMFLAGRYELKEVASSGDTMASVVAVLDTNYYLAIHVTTIAMGYAGGLLAAAIAHVWIFGKLFGLRKGDKEFYKAIARMTYGVVCFSLLFSIFGTIMGGIWANDSWGRFWGWDPKENGALLICIWQLLILHARMGGFIRDRGLAVLAVLGGVVVSASWWGVNLLSVGLHSYGFTSGVMLTLGGMWVLELIVVALAGVEFLLDRARAAGAASAAASDPLT